MKITVTVVNYTRDTFEALYHGINDYFSVLPHAVMDFPGAMEFEIPECSHKWVAEAIERIAAAYGAMVYVVVC